MTDEEIEQLLRETMADFWKQNSLGQRYEVVRQALRKAAGKEDTERKGCM